MAKGDKPKDAREALTQLEKRLRDLERELRASAPPAPAAAEPAEAPTAPGATPPVPPIPETAAPAAPPVPEQPAAAEAPTPEGPPAPVVPPPVPAEIEVLVEEARVRADALRESLESLVDVNDHLRETAGTVIEDHGRALAELDAARAEPAAEPVPPPPPDPDAEFAALGALPPARPPWEPAEPQRPRRRRWLTVLLLLLLLGALAAAAYVVRERRRDQSTPTPTTPAPAAIAVSAPTGMQLGIVGARRFTANAAPQAVCAGIAVAAIVAAADATHCATAVVITTVTDSAFGLVGPRLKGGGRRCFSIVHDEELAPHDDDPALNRRRAAAIEAARTIAQTAARTDQLPPARVARAGNDAAAQAAAAWDARRDLVSRAVAARPGATCVRPTPANVSSGRYPLAHRVSLIATSETRATPAVAAAAAALRTAYGGEAPLDAHVLR